MSSNRVPECSPPLLFPRRPSNAPALPHIQYRIGSYADIRAWLMNALDLSLDLQGLTHREPDDPAIALLEGAAIVADILTFYQEHYANEAFLRTASWRESIADLVRLTGYRLTPGIGGIGTFYLELRGEAPVTVPAGFPLRVELARVDAPADMQTTDAIVAYPWLSGFELFAPMQSQPIAPGTREFRMASSPGWKLKSGDRLLLFAHPSSPPATLDGYTVGSQEYEFVSVDEVESYHGEVLFSVVGSLRLLSASPGTLSAVRVGRTFRHFGHDAPKLEHSASSGTTTAQAIGYGREASASDMTSRNTTTFPTLDRSEVALDRSVDDLAPGTAFVCDYDSSLELRTIDSTRPITATWGALSGASTQVSLSSDIVTSNYDVRLARFFEVTSGALPFEVQAQRRDQSGSGRKLHFFGPTEQAASLTDRRLALCSAAGEPLLTRVDAITEKSDPKSFELTLATEVEYADFPNRGTPLVTVRGNLVDATQGKAEPRRVLGTGDARQTFQTFKVPKAPLTYLHQVGETPPEVPELVVYVDGAAWQRVASFYGHGPKETIYVVREDSQGASVVQFGDGLTGARLPSGLDNVSAEFRTGSGAYGPIKPGTNPSPGARLENLRKTGLLGVVAGGGAPESGAKAQRVAPGKLQSLGRLVSLSDFEAEANAIGGVAVARASWELVENIPTVRLTVVMAPGRSAEIDSIRDILRGYNRCRGPDRFPLQIVEGKFLYVLCELHVALDPGLRQEAVEFHIQQALGVAGVPTIDENIGLFATSQRQLGEKEYASRVEGIVQNVAGVRFVRVMAFAALGEADDPTTLALPPAPRPLNATLDCSSTQVLRLFDGAPRTGAFQLLTFSSGTTEVCV